MGEGEPKITVRPHGPYLVRGQVPLVRKSQVETEYGEPYDWKREEVLETTETYRLCRCGQSQNKPFCDGILHRFCYNICRCFIDVTSSRKDMVFTVSRDEYTAQACNVLEALQNPSTEIGHHRVVFGWINNNTNESHVLNVISNADLTCARMNGADLSMTNLGGADLSGANLGEANRSNFTPEAVFGGQVTSI